MISDPTAPEEAVADVLLINPVLLLINPMLLLINPMLLLIKPMPLIINPMLLLINNDTLDWREQKVVEAVADAVVLLIEEGTT